MLNFCAYSSHTKDGYDLKICRDEYMLKGYADDVVLTVIGHQKAIKELRKTRFFNLLQEKCGCQDSWLHEMPGFVPDR